LADSRRTAAAGKLLVRQPAFHLSIFDASMLKFGFKYYYVGFILVFLVYGFIAYKALKSAYLSDHQYRNETADP
jgi:hypothetical protein